MGMGEPLLNLNEVVKSITWINKFMRIGARNFTVSTVGIPRGIRKLGSHKLQLTLAVSLHAPTQELRETLIPNAKHYPLEDLFKACRWYFHATGRRLTFEYVLLNGINDSEETAKELAKTLAANKVRNPVNLMLWNRVKGIDYERPSWQTALRFKSVLESFEIPVTIRKSRGLDKKAACGQLSNEHQKRPLQEFEQLF